MLEAAAIECVRQRRLLFSGLSFSVGGGELLRVAGQNGSGKTSLLRILCGLLAPAAGEVRWRGTPIGELKEEYGRELVYLGHAPALKDELSAAENLAVAARLCGLSPSGSDIAAALALFQVPDSPVRQLSQGQKRRVALARVCLAHGAPLWLLDEPFTALDAAGIDLLKALINGHAARGKTVIYTTHQDPGLAATRVVELG